jgi:hypothetical protein
MCAFRALKLFLADCWRIGQEGDVVEIEISERWASLAEPLRELMAEVKRDAHADRTTRAPFQGRRAGDRRLDPLSPARDSDRHDLLEVIEDHRPSGTSTWATPRWPTPSWTASCTTLTGSC